MDRLRKTLKPKLEEVVEKHGVKLHDLFITYAVEDNLVKFRVEVEVDVSGKVANVIPCIYWDELYTYCSETVNTKEADEEEVEKEIEKCVESEVEEHRKEHNTLPFEFSYRRKDFVEAHLETREVEDSTRSCIRDMLVTTFYVQSSIGYLREVVGDAEALQRVIDRDTQYVVGELESILRALETLA